MRIFGLIGNPLAHSQSPAFFSQKFENKHIKDAQYRLFPLEEITDIFALLDREPALCGVNVTTPYKEKIIPYLDALSPAAKAIGAVNVINIHRSNERAVLIGHNSDYIGFQRTMQLLDTQPSSALILGTGGAAKAVAYALKLQHIPYQFVSRNKENSPLTYSLLTQEIIQKTPLIIQATPQGMWPHIKEKPFIPYQGITPQHFLIDLIYNPIETEFLKEGKQRGAKIINGATMLHAQAEASWEIWNRD